MNKKKRKTVQNTIILDVVERIKPHASADEIYQEVMKIHPHISRATVYRNLKQLADSNMIRRVEVPDSADCFEHRCEDHYHVKCVECSKLFDVDMLYMKDLEKSIQDKHGFQFISHDIIFKGICPKCKDNFEKKEILK